MMGGGGTFSVGSVLNGAIVIVLFLTLWTKNKCGRGLSGRVDGTEDDVTGWLPCR